MPPKIFKSAERITFSDDDSSSSREPTPSQNQSPLKRKAPPALATSQEGTDTKRLKVQQETKKGLENCKAPNENKRLRREDSTVEEKRRREDNKSTPSHGEGPRDNEDSSESETDSGSGEEEDSDSDSEHDASSEGRTPEQSDEDTTRQRSVRLSHSASLSFQSTPPSAPPARIPLKGYSKLEPATNGYSSAALKLLNPSDLEGKQIWHIAVAGSLHLEEMREIALDDLEKGKVMCTQEGREFTLVSGSKGTKGDGGWLLVPSESGERYEINRRQIDEYFQIQPVLRNKNSRENSQQDSPQNAPHTQPFGLRQRYWPIGFEPSSMFSPDGQGAGPRGSPTKHFSEITSSSTSDNGGSEASGVTTSNDYRTPMSKSNNVTPETSSSSSSESVETSSESGKR